jgi:membrane-associated phospholipid phosphatase
MLSILFPRLHRFVVARLSPEEATGLHMTIGLALMVAAAWVFGGIAEDVVDGDDITVLDAWLANWLHHHAAEPMTSVMLVITHWHSMVGSAIMALLLAAFFYVRKLHYWLLAELFVVPGGMLLNVLLKYVFQRERPSFDEPLLTLTTYSFPSGHTANAALLYGLIGCWLWMRYRRPRARAAIVGAACAMVALVAFSRMYLGVHYLSDVLAASAEGVAWLAVCVTGVSTLRRRRAMRAAQQSTIDGSLN